jgi:preprotein translocase subunit SecE
LIRVRILVPVHNREEKEMANVSEYLKESYIELTQKVTWPTGRELWSSTMLVLAATVIISLIVLGMDQLIGLILKGFYSSLG